MTWWKQKRRRTIKEYKSLTYLWKQKEKQINDLQPQMYLIFHHHQRHNDWPAQHSQKNRQIFFSCAAFNVEKKWNVKMRMEKKSEYFWWGLCGMYERFDIQLWTFLVLVLINIPMSNFFVSCLSQFHNKHMNNARTHVCRGFQGRSNSFEALDWMKIDNI